MFKIKSFSHRHILAYVYGLLLKQSLDDFKARWNSHRIRRNRVAGCPDGVPDDLYNLPQLNGMTLIITVIYIMVITSVHLGTRSYKQELDLEVWVYCFLEYAQNAPSFYPDEFRMAADSILCELHTTRQDITYDTARPIYLHLCNLMS